MTEPFISSKSGQFSYFSKQLHQDTWRGKYVLDFGGNVGNLLRDPNCTIDEERYWCLDIVKEALEQGCLAYPKAHWIFYNRYSFAFNPDGIPGLAIPRLDRQFDFIVAFSVFTNTKPSEMFELVEQLKAGLLDDGILAFTFIDPNHWALRDYSGSNFQWRLEEERQRGLLAENEKYDLLRRAQFAEWFMLVNGRCLYVESEAIQDHSEEQKTCYVFHTEEYMRRHFPDASILPPVNNEMQHCCVLTKH